MTTSAFEIFLVATPGHEATLGAEARDRGFAKVRVVPGGVTIKGTWPEAWRANLELRGASRVIARIANFRVPRMEDLETRAKAVAWRNVLRPDVPFHVDATCRQSRIYHSGAAEERIAKAIQGSLPAPLAPDAEVRIMARIDNDVCTLGIDTSGEPLHKRGHKEEITKAPMRETLAAMFLRQCSWDGREPVLDPMCGSGTFIIEAAEIAAGLKPGRTRRFAFEQLATFKQSSWLKIRDRGGAHVPDVRFYGSDRDGGAIRMSRANAERAGVAAYTEFQPLEIRELTAPPGPPGLVIVNPPYGSRIGDKSKLASLYKSLGQVLVTGFGGWRVGLITTERALADATGLPFQSTAEPVSNGGQRVTLYRTATLA